MIMAVFTVAGESDALIWLRVRDMGHLKQSIDHLRRTGNVTGTKTMMILGSWMRD